MNAHSQKGRCQGSPAPLRETIRPILLRRAIDRGHDVGACCGRGDGVDVKVQVRDLDAELEKHRAIAARLAQEDALGLAMDAGKMPELVGLEVGHILHVTLPDDHRVTGHAAVRMERYGAVIILMDDCAESREVADRVAERTMH